MASFRVTATEPAPHLGNDDDQVFALQPSQHQEGLLHRVWTVHSAKKVGILALNLPGVVFIDYDANLSSSEAPAGSSSANDPESEASNEGGARAQVAESGIVAKVVVTSDSSDLLEGLEVVPLDDDDDDGFKFRVKNEDAELKGSILTRVLVSDKNQLRRLSGSTAEFVLGDAVLVQQDRTATVEVSVFNSGSLYLSSKEGFSLRSFDAMVEGTGIYQLQAPSFDLQEGLSLMTFGLCTLAITADSIFAKTIRPIAMMKYGDIVVHTSTLKAKAIDSIIGYRGSINIVGNGEVKKHRACVVVGGELNAGGIVSEKTEVFIVWSGRAVVSARKELHADNPLFGIVEYTNVKPEVMTDSSWVWWKKESTPNNTMTPATAKFYEFREPPLRQPVPIHHRVKSSKRGEPQLVKPNATSWVSRYSKLGLLAGVVAVGAIVVIGSRRKTARLD